MMLPCLTDDSPFPPAQTARQNHGGLLALGGGLAPERLLSAYRLGIFPWGTWNGQPLWYCPDPRMVLAPGDLRITRSLRKTLRQAQYEIRLDHDFPATIAACSSTPRPGQDGTWISPDMLEAYTRLHTLGWAHSVETWVDGQLVGGLYGLAIGRMFYGESMFSHRTDASKIAFAHLARYLAQQDFGLIDCQVYTPHLASLGAREIPQSDFLAEVARLCQLPAHQSTPGSWPVGAACGTW